MCEEVTNSTENAELVLPRDDLHLAEMFAQDSFVAGPHLSPKSCPFVTAAKDQGQAGVTWGWGGGSAYPVSPFLGLVNSA